MTYKISVIKLNPMVEREGILDMLKRSLSLKKLINNIQIEESRLGSAEVWTEKETERLANIRRMRHRLPKGHVVPARENLGELFHLPHSKKRLDS